MFHILSNTPNLPAHIKRLSSAPEDYLPTHCPTCGHPTLWKHGYYYRMADRANKLANSLNPVAIPRYRCARCRRTCSTLPQCLPPRRWYDWLTQEQALKGCIKGQRYRQIAKTMLPSRTTIARWLRHLKQRFALHADHLRQRLRSLQFKMDFNAFWQCCLCHTPLSQAMLSLHRAKISIP